MNEREFRYEAMDATGFEKGGTIFAKDEDHAQYLIRQQGYFCTRIQEVLTDHRTYGTMSPEPYKFEFKMTGFIIGFIIGTIITLILRCLT